MAAAVAELAGVVPAIPAQIESSRELRPELLSLLADGGVLGSLLVDAFFTIRFRSGRRPLHRIGRRRTRHASSASSALSW